MVRIRLKELCPDPDCAALLENTYVCLEAQDGKIDPEDVKMIIEAIKKARMEG